MRASGAGLSRSLPSAGGSRGTSLGLTVAALGVVFGDIGTSPLYTLAQCFAHLGQGPPHTADVLGLLSLVLWALTLVVSVKYILFVMQADNQGEGGLFALLALLAVPRRGASSAAAVELDAPGLPSPGGWAAGMVMAGAALLYGDGIITPTISVLSAMEGLRMASPSLSTAVLPLSCGVLAGLFGLQRRGPGSVGRLFGPVMAVWFAVIGGLGLWQVVRCPTVLAAVNPMWAVRYFAGHGLRGAAVLGAVVLAVTGGEALYADMGQFGRTSVRAGWFALVMPSLLLNYLGQGALVLREHSLRGNPFFAMVPTGGWAVALVVLATAATVIASQAMITGAFSMTHQAIQLGFLPRLRVEHTSPEEEGQVYVPAVNALLAVACLLLALAFRHSDRLAAAYGIAVTGTMTITSVVYFEVTRKRWHWSLGLALAVLLFFFSVDLPLLAGNLVKIRQGGFVPLLVGALSFLAMAIWHRGRAIYQVQLEASAQPFERLLQHMDELKVLRTPGVGITLSGDTTAVPPVLGQLVRRVACLPETIVLVTVAVRHAPHASEASDAIDLGHGFYRIMLACGYMDKLNLPRVLAPALQRARLSIDVERVTYFVGRDSFVASSAGRMGALAEHVFAALARNANSLSGHFSLPAHQVVEIGEQHAL